jgi:hypothetical protein
MGSTAPRPAAPSTVFTSRLGLRDEGLEYARGQAIGAGRRVFLRTGESSDEKFPDLRDIDPKLAVAAVIHAPRPASM